MKTNVGIETTDEERKLIGEALGLKRKVSRKELREEIDNHVQSLIAGAAVVKVPVEAAERILKDEPSPERDRSVREFVPSRGDEDYLAQPKDPGIAAACSRILDDVALIEQFAWDTIERNRKT